MADQLCPKCGGAVNAGVCSQCGHNVNLELEIAAFQGPHIKRTRITLVVIGALYAILGVRMYGQVGDLQKQVDAMGGASGEVKKLMTILWALVIYQIVAGVANIVLGAVVAGKKTMLAFNIALGLFILHTCLQVYASGGAIFTNPFWILIAIFIGLGYGAARKAEQMRAQAAPSL
jgi:hypothetical protein